MGKLRCSFPHFHVDPTAEKGEEEERDGESAEVMAEEEGDAVEGGKEELAEKVEEVI